MRKIELKHEDDVYELALSTLLKLNSCKYRVGKPLDNDTPLNNIAKCLTKLDDLAEETQNGNENAFVNYEKVLDLATEVSVYVLAVLSSVKRENEFFSDLDIAEMRKEISG